mmetsp:Transcript_31719/g.68659  ORF Transcript_31719/g.68659 Transcript_31719/m.68659 type:complete len:173 (+) Transcript_31719:158-676(+)
MLGGISVLITPLLGINASHVLEINAGDSTLRSIDVDTLEDVQTLIDALDAGGDDDIALALVMSPTKFFCPSINALLIRLRKRGLLRLRIICVDGREAYQYESLSLLPLQNNTVDSKTREGKSHWRREMKNDGFLLAADESGAYASQDRRSQVLQGVDIPTPSSRSPAAAQKK